MPSTIFSGSDVKTLSKSLDLNGGAKIISSATNPTSSAVNAPIGSLLLNESSGNIYKKNDVGATTNWTDISAGGGGSATPPATWTSFTPTLTWTAGLSGLTGYYCTYGTICEVKIGFNVSGTVTGSTLYITNPGTIQFNTSMFPTVSGWGPNLMPLDGVGYYYDQSIDTLFYCFPVCRTSTQLQVFSYLTATSTKVGALNPVTLTNPAIPASPDNFRIWYKFQFV